MQHKLYTFQEEAVEFFIRRKKGFLRLDTGLGKTAVALTLAKRLNCNRVLVVCPAYLQANWKKEAKLWWPSSKGKLVIASYGVLSRKNGRSFGSDWDLVICDEAHYLKNLTSRRTKRLISETLHHVDRVVYSSATPYVRSALDYYSLLFGIKANGSYNPDKFKNKFCQSKPNPFARYPGAKIWYGYRKDTADELRAMITPYMFSRKKKDVLHDLPDKQVIEHELTVGGEYKLENALPDGAESAYFDIESGKIVGGQSSLAKAARELGLAKAHKAMDYILDFEETRPLAIFVRHKDVAALIVQRLEEKGIRCESITGDISNQKRESSVSDFTSGKLKRLVLTFGAGGTGLNLQVADTCYVVELPWSYTELKQAEDRLHRIGQKSSVLIKRFLTRGTVDDLLLSQIDSKVSGESETVGHFE